MKKRYAICIDNTHRNLTKGRRYELLELSPFDDEDFIHVIDDNGHRDAFYDWRFKEIIDLNTKIKVI
jgi:hypothetical protein